MASKKVESKVEKKGNLLEEPFNTYQIIKFPIATEKCVRKIEFDNVLTFCVHTRATKKDVRKAVEEMFKVKISKINVQNSVSGVKKAFVKLTPEFLASDISADLGFI